jgi:hypothetical protein
MNDRDCAIVVGINLYPGFSPLDGAEYDAKAFAAWLAEPGGGDLPCGNIQKIVTSQFHPPLPTGPVKAKPIGQHFDDALGAILPQVQEQSGRRLYLYFSGHGFQGSARPEEAAVYTANATQFQPYHIAGTRVAERAQMAAVFEEIVLVMDCCRGIKLTQQILDPFLNLPVNAPGAANVKTFFAYGAPIGAAARERAFPPDTQVCGVFTHVLLEALRRASPDPQGRVLGSQVKNYVHTKWPQYSLDAQPKFAYDTAQEIVFATRPAGTGTAVHFTLSPPLPAPSELVITGAALPQEAHVPTQEGQAHCALPPGLYKASLSGTDRTVLFEAIGAQVNATL